MAKHVYSDGTVILTGKDMVVAMQAMCDRRGAYDISCAFCIHEDDDTHCAGCTILDTDYGCSCHLNPPCSYCVGSKFEVSPHLINYKAHKERRTQWQCFKSNEETCAKVAALEDAGFHLSAEILSTGESAMYVGDDSNPDFAIEICWPKEFRAVMCKMIMAFDVGEAERAKKEICEPPKQS